MILSRTPLRISFVGGGTDISNFYREHGGEVISTAIDKYISVRITKRTDSQIVINTPHHCETVSNPDHIQHPLIREAVRKSRYNRDDISITVTSDVTSRGCGLGSSSALTVGLLNALYAYQGIERSAETLARQACEIEIERLKQPIGKQDQYIAAYGGLKRIQFNRDESVDTHALPVTLETIACLEEDFILFYTGIQRRAETILYEQKRSASPQTLLQIKELVAAFYDVLVNALPPLSPPPRQIGMRTQAGRREKSPTPCPPCRGKIPFAENLENTDQHARLGELLHRTWELKRSLCDSISNPMLDTIYERAIAAGALGGKILGAGGGGYFLFYVPKSKQQTVTTSLSDLGLSPLKFYCEPKGSQIIE